jgi:protein-disulfide isomerase
MPFRLRSGRIAGLLLACAALIVAQDWKTATTLNGVDFAGLSPAKFKEALVLLRGYDCTCGCGMKVAQCRVEDPGCSYSKGLATAIVDALRAGKNDADALAAAKTSKYGATPAPPKLLEDPVQITTAGSPSIGLDKAPVTLIEFSDFQCPYCYKAAAELAAVLKAYPTQVRLVFREYPLESHSQAALAAAAAIAAHRQGKFWPLHDAMFAHRTELSKANITAWAAKTGLDMKRFAADWASKETAATIARDIQDGDRAGVDGTPTIYVNGKRYHGALGPEAMKPVIEAELKKK